MEEVTIDQLEEGDHIVISCQSFFKYLIVLRKPEIGKKTHWKTGAPLYRTVKCSSRRDTTVKTWTYVGITKTYNSYTWIFTPEDHNITQYLTLEGRQILRINK